MNDNEYKAKNLTIFTLSDSTGQTAETLAKAALRLFRGIVQGLRYERLPRIVDSQQMDRIMKLVSQEKPCVIAYTLSVPHLRDTLKQLGRRYQIPMVDLLGPLIKSISSAVGTMPHHEEGMRHTLDEEYFKRIEAIEFAIKLDDGKDPRNIMKADIVLIGVSRTSKTPTCMYLAQNYGIKAANIPIIHQVPPPKELYELPCGKVIGLRVQPDVLHNIRTARLKSLGLPPGSSYADYEQIVKELEYASKLMEELGCPIVEVSHKAVEETASEIQGLRSPKSITKELHSE